MNRGTLSERDTLLTLIDYILPVLDELEEMDLEGKLDARGYGQKMALVECLEIVQRWKDAEKIGLDWDIEENFPV